MCRGLAYAYYEQRHHTQSRGGGSQRVGHPHMRTRDTQSFDEETDSELATEQSPDVQYVASKYYL